MTEGEENNELTEKELVFYGNFGYTQECDCCHKDAPIHKYDFYHERDNEDFIQYNGKQFICCNCGKE